MSFKQYRTMDVILFMVLSGICEFGIIKAANAMIDQAYVISLMLPILLLVIMRWSIWALPQAIVSAILYVLFNGGDGKQMLIYIIGNLGVLLLILMFRRIGKEKIRTNAGLTAIYIVLGFLLMQCSRFIATIVVTASFQISTLIRFILTDALGLVFSFLVIFIARNMDGLFMDQKTYLIRLQEEKKAEESAY